MGVNKISAIDCHSQVATGMNTIRRYEAEFRRTVEAHTARSFWKGRTALYAILKALGIGKDDEVLLPGFTCVVVANAVRLSGAVPVYVDIGRDTYNMDPRNLLERITLKSRAIIVQHTFGIPAEMDPLLEIAERHHLHIIEDCAHALGSTYKGKPVGSFGAAAFFSSQWSKPYTTGLGGMAITSDVALSQRINEIQEGFGVPSKGQLAKLYIQYRLYNNVFSPRLYWRSVRALELLSRLRLFVGSSTQHELGGHRPVDAEWRMSSLQAGIGLKRLHNLGADQGHREVITHVYEDRLERFGWPPVEVPESSRAIFLRYPIRVANKALLLQRARYAGIELGSWFESPLHPIHDGLDRYGYEPGSCPNAENTATEVVNLPVHPRVSVEEAKRIAEFVCNAGERPACVKRLRPDAPFVLAATARS